MSDRPGWKHGSSSQLEWDSFALGNQSSFVTYASSDADKISVKEAVEDIMLVFEWLLILRMFELILFNIMKDFLCKRFY